MGEKILMGGIPNPNSKKVILTCALKAHVKISIKCKYLLRSIKFQSCKK